MTPDLQLSVGESRLGGTRLTGAPDSIHPRRSTSAFDNAGGPQTFNRMTSARISSELEDVEEGLAAPGLAGVDEIPENLQPALPLDARQLDHVASLFKLLSDKTRLAILQILCEGELNVTSLCRRLKLPQPTVSHHLGLLRMNRLIANRRSGKQVYYKLHDRVAGAGAPGTGHAREAQDRDLAGIQIADEGFAVQIAARRPSGSAVFSSLDGVLHAAQ